MQAKRRCNVRESGKVNLLSFLQRPQAGIGVVYLPAFPAPTRVRGVKCRKNSSAECIKSLDFFKRIHIHINAYNIRCMVSIEDSIKVINFVLKYLCKKT